MSERQITKAKLNTRDLVRIGMFAAFLAVVSQLSIPMPAGVPITIQVFAVAVVGTVLGWKLGTLSVLVYILVGAVGMPVFANFRGGLEVLVGTSGGYIFGWIFMALLCGIHWDFEDGRKSLLCNVLFALLGLAIVEGLGAFQWATLAGGNLREIMFYSLAAFIPKDIVITILGVIFGRQLKKIESRVLQR